MKEHLHRVGPEPDWKKIQPKDWNFWQQLAARTGGIATPGNGASLLGLTLVVWGILDISAGHTLAGLIKIAFGRIFDLIDGTIADKTGTKSLIGEATDATVDKLELAVGLPVLITMGILPLPVGLMVLAQNLANVGMTVIAKSRGIEMHPSHLGKITTVVQWTALALYVAAAAAHLSNPELAPIIKVLAHIVAVAFVAVGVVTTVNYAREALAKYSAGR